MDYYNSFIVIVRLVTLFTKYSKLIEFNVLG